MKNKKITKIILASFILFFIISFFFYYKSSNNLSAVVEKYSKQNYTSLGLEKINASVIISTKELYNRKVISKRQYEKFRDVVFKIILLGDNEIDIKKYSKEYDYENPVIVLKGPTNITLECKTDYTEPGYTVDDNKDKDLEKDVKISGNVNTNKVGKYTLTYKVSDKSGNGDTAKRVINVVDTTAPILKLVGKNTTYVYRNSIYRERGIKSAIDNVDGDVSDTLEINDNIDTSVLGTYKVTYTVQDKSGNITEKFRTVNVIRKRIVVTTTRRRTTTRSTTTTTRPITTTTTTTTTTTRPITTTTTTTTTTTRPPSTNPADIVLNGSSIITVYLYEEFSDPGVASAIDDEDGDLKNNVVVTGSVNTDVVGTYDLAYSVTNSRDITATVVREVRVVKAPDVLTDFTFSGLEDNITIPGIYEDNVERTFNVSGGVNQYGDSMDLTNIEWSVNKSGVYITEGVLEVSNDASVGDVTISVTIDSITKTKTISLVKVPILYTFDIYGDSDLNVSGIANTESTYTVDNAKDQYGDGIAINASNNVWSVIESPEYTSITDGLLTVTPNVTLGDIIIRVQNGDIIQTKVISLNKISVSSVVLKDSGTTITGETIEMMIDDTRTITAEISPSNATVQSGAWLSSNPSKVSVSDGVITAVSGAQGDLIEISYTVDGVSSSFNVEIITDPVRYSVESVTMEYGDKETIVARARSGDIAYTSSDTSIATVEATTGTITIVGVGSATITATVDGVGSDTLSVTANKAVVDVILFSGQSNMQGAAGVASTQLPTEGTAWEYRASTNSIKTLTSDVGETTATSDAAMSGSLVTSFAKEYVSKFDRKVMAVHSAKSGITSALWLPDGGILEAAESRYNNAITYIEGSSYFTVGRRLFVWLQGESDMQYSDYKDTYKSNFLAIRDDIITNTDIEQFLLIRVGNSPSRALSAVKPVVIAQNELAYEHSDIIMGTKSGYEMSFTPSLMKEDMLHYNITALDALGKEAVIGYDYYLDNNEELYMIDTLLPQNEANKWTYLSNIHDSVGGLTSTVTAGAITPSNGKVTLDGSSYITLSSNITLSYSSPWAIEFTGKLSDLNSNGMLFTKVDNSDTYLWLDGSTNKIKLRSSASTEVTFDVDGSDLTSTNRWKLEYLPAVKEITLYKNDDYVTRSSYTASTNFVFDGMFGGYKDGTYQKGFNGEIEEVVIYDNDALTKHVESIDLNFTEFNLMIDQTKTISYNITPVLATNQDVTFVSSDTDVVTVDASGNVTGIAEGTATITITADDNNTSASFSITVSDELYELTKPIPTITGVTPLYSRIIGKEFTSTDTKQAVLLSDFTPSIIRQITKEYTFVFRIRNIGNSTCLKCSANMLLQATSDSTKVYGTSGNHFVLGLPNILSTTPKIQSGSVQAASTYGTDGEEWHTIAFRNTAANVTDYFYDGTKINSGLTGPFASTTMTAFFANITNNFGVYFGGLTQKIVSTNSYYGFAGAANYMSVYNTALTDYQIAKLALGGDTKASYGTKINVRQGDTVVNSNTLYVSPSDSKQLTFEVLPSSLIDKAVTISKTGSANIDIDQDGLITVSSGAAYNDTIAVTVSLTNTPAITTTFNVKVGINNTYEMSRPIPSVADKTPIYSKLLNSYFPGTAALALTDLTKPVISNITKEYTFVFRVNQNEVNTTTWTWQDLLEITGDTTKNWATAGGTYFAIGMPNASSATPRINNSLFVGTTATPNPYYYASTAPSTSKWHTVVFRNSAANVSDYFLDGTKINSNITGPFSSTTMAAAFETTANYGAYFGGLVKGHTTAGDFFFKGYGNYMAIYNTALSDAEVISLTSNADNN